ncbi:hypothetical protein SAT01_25310 [Sinomonas atrocyanea]|nr:hypothetical protein SAT01_25310 [Sinomonas atrocyanea]GGG63315.1 hypothetical protein GCM10007172_13200 [Sinomonas atrocyanea]
MWGLPVVLLLALACRRLAAGSRKGATRACAAGIGAVIVLESAWMALAGALGDQPNVLMVVFGVVLAIAGVMVSSVYWRAVR